MGQTLMVGQGTGYATDFPPLFPEPLFFHGLINKTFTEPLTPIIVFHDVPIFHDRITQPSLSRKIRASATCCDQPCRHRPLEQE
ncbi:MAG: hypothetical protein WD060_00785, partial [Pirellulales bacterium]